MRLWGRLGVMGVVVCCALALSAPLALAKPGGSRYPDNSTQVGPLKVRIYSQMCDGFGARLHTRLNIKNTSSTPQKVLVQDGFSKITYDPTDTISPGKGTLIHLTSSRQTPARVVTVHQVGGASAKVAVAESPCPTTPTNPPTTPTNPPTTPTNPPTTPTNPPTTPTVPVEPGGGPPVYTPGQVGSTGGLPTTSAGTVQRAASGTLPFTGSDMRLYALIGNVLVLVGFTMLLLSHRKRQAALKALTPATLEV
jgi:hypothetical protein